MRDGRRIEVETLDCGVSVKTATRKRREPFVMITASQVHRLQQLEKESPAAAGIFIRLLFLNYKSGGRPFALPGNATNVGRIRKQRAISDLEKVGLISVQRSSGQPSLITVNFSPKMRSK
jgi:hypothetical protein